MSQHEPERDLKELQDQTERLGDRISEAKEQWEAKKADPGVPGADPGPDNLEGDDPKLTAYPAKGDEDELGGDERLDPQDPENEDL